jgi:hypothetical protein
VSRKRCRRQVIMPMPPRGLRPKLDKLQKSDLSLVHHHNLDLIARGQADEAVLWDWVGGCLTWSRTAELLQLGVPEMADQVALAMRLVARYHRTGRVAFNGPDYQLAKAGTIVMDLLAEATDQATASAAADWSERKIGQMAEALRGTVAAAAAERQAA